MARRKYKACVETGWHDQARSTWETSVECGHLHRTVEAAEKCGAKHYQPRYEHGNWTANAAWYNYTIHDQNDQRVER